MCRTHDSGVESVVEECQFLLRIFWLETHAYTFLELDNVWGGAFSVMFFFLPLTHSGVFSDVP